MANDKENQRINIWGIILSIIISLVFSFVIYLLFLQTPVVSKRELLVAFMIFLALIWPVYFLTDRFLFKQLRSYPLRKKVALIFGSALLGSFILLSTNRPPLYIISPTHTFLISVPASNEEANPDRTVTISWITRDLGDVSFAQLKRTGKWIVSENGISHKGPEGATLEWKGKTGENISIVLESTSSSNPVYISWDGQQTTLDLAGSVGKTQIVSRTFDAKEGHHPLIVATLWFAASFLFLLVTVVLLTFKFSK